MKRKKPNTLAQCAYILALFLPISAHGAPLPPGEYAYQALNLADMAQTLDIKRHGDIHEGNPILGDHPSDGSVVAFKLATGALHAAITEYMISHGASRRVVRIWEVFSVGMGTAVVGHNASLGLHVRF